MARLLSSTARYVPCSRARRQLGMPCKNRGPMLIAGRGCTFVKHRRTKSWKVSVHFSHSESLGGSSRLMRKMTRIGWTVHRGGMVSAISIAVMPSAHMSTCSLRVQSQVPTRSESEMATRFRSCIGRWPLTHCVIAHVVAQLGRDHGLHWHVRLRVQSLSLHECAVTRDRIAPLACYRQWNGATYMGNLNVGVTLWRCVCRSVMQS